jgi:oxygen-independent coproporphyrinogen-3 oxidase
MEPRVGDDTGMPVTEAQAPDTIELLRRFPSLRLEHDEYDYNVTATYGSELARPDVEEAAKHFDGTGQAAHLYFHLPLCNYICHYCNFVKALLPSGEQGSATLKEWIGLLITESRRYLSHFNWPSQLRIESIYLGGGTFALLLDQPDELARFMDHVRSNYSLTKDCEVTLEGNPDNYTREKLEVARQLGFNRYSVGVQTLDDDIQRLSGRGHTAADSFAAISALHELGRPFNVDMIYGLPSQTVDSFAADIRRLIGANSPTITMYRLRNTDRRPLATGIRAAWTSGAARDRLLAESAFPRSEDAHRMRDAATQVLLDAAYRPGPSCWWSRPGTYRDGIPQVARNKWQRYDTMIAFGPGTYSWLTRHEGDILQMHNAASLGHYAKALRSDELPIRLGRKLSTVEAVGTALGFNFKACRPIQSERYLTEYGVRILEEEPYASVLLELVDGGFLERQTGDVLVPTLSGEALHEEIISVFFHGRIAKAATLPRRAVHG